MFCVKPAWTLCFGFVWALVGPGAYLTHVSLSSLLPHLKDLPKNIVEGFDETFKFAYLERDSQSVENAAGDALSKCGVIANESCTNASYPPLPPQQTSNTSDEQALIAASFETSLSVVNKITNDKYFGVEGFSSAAESLENIIDNMKQLNGTMTCQESTPVFCSIYASAGDILDGMSSVNQAVNKFKNSDIVERWEDHQQFLILLHGLPYIMVVALLFFSYFWMKGGVCCCCKGGTTAMATLALLPFALFWLLSFAIYLAICIMGVTVKYAADRIDVPVLKGSPSLEMAIDHIQATFPEFWNLVFAGMADGSDLLLKASFFFVAACSIAGVYSICVCCRCPYRKDGKDEF